MPQPSFSSERNVAYRLEQHVTPVFDMPKVRVPNISSTTKSLLHLIGLEVNHHKNLSDLLHGDKVSSEICILHHLPELVRLDGESATNALARGETVVLEHGQDGLVEGCNSFLNLHQRHNSGAGCGRGTYPISRIDHTCSSWRHHFNVRVETQNYDPTARGSMTMGRG